ncbi:hypothetical protein IFM89_031598 [Coptis chinensis]|uniref:glutamate--tRNA ligase n=1 Tax=Coptis chinensis TaxID=261450 RepID=A0A835H8T8_9MAGN|nr:hypothetical protein IFM89_031598 [Coptis chinensis]
MKREKLAVGPTFEVDLSDAKVGEVCLRFAPEPSGYLHIGHSKAALLNKYFADRYKGQLIIRFDDTNPSKEKTEFVDNILKDIKTLGKAYVDDTPQEQMQKERIDGIESKCTNNSPENNMKLWKEMIAGSERGSKYKVYPTYDFACPFVDATEGITHALCSSEYADRNAQYCRILEDMGLQKVQIYEFSRLNMVYTLLSKRKLGWFVENGKVDGWDDPRFPTVRGTRNSKGLVQRRQPTQRIWLDYADASAISVGEEITLMDWGNALITEIGKDNHGNVTQLTGVLHLEGSVKTTKVKLTWLPETEDLINLSLLDFGYLIAKKKLDEGEDFIDVLNPRTKKETLALGDSNMRNLQRGEILQLERKGYFICDVPYSRSSKPIVLLSIPDGRQQTSLLKCV